MFNVIILSSGQSTRLKPITNNIPKVLVNVGTDTALLQQAEFWNQFAKLDKIYVVAHPKYVHMLEEYCSMVMSEDNLGNRINKRMIGIQLGAYNNQINHVKLSPAKSLYYSINEVYFVCASSLKYLASIIKGTGDSSQLGGPIRIAKITGQVAEFGVLPFLNMMAYISVSLGLINLFPIPLLDGGI